MAKKEVKLPYDKTNEIKPLVAYFAIVNQGNAGAVIDIFRRAGSTASFVQMGTGTASKHVWVSKIIEKKLLSQLLEKNY